MPQASGSRKQVAYVSEATFGQTPVTPQTQLIEFVDFKATLDTPLITDNSIRTDRQTSYERRGNESVQGEI